MPGHLWPTASINPYGAVKDAAELNDAYVANNDDLRDLGAKNGLSGGVYTQITDVEGEQNGFFTYDRQVLKVDEARVRASNLSVIDAGSEPAPPPPAGTPGLDGVGRWTFDEGQGSTAADSAGTNPLTLHGDPTWVDGPTGDAKTALHLTGTQYADTEQTVVPTRGTNFSVSAWVRLDSADGAFQTVVSEDGDTNSAFFLQYSGADQRWAFSYVGARALATDVGKPEVGRWYHLVGVRDTTASTLTVYVDGKAEGSTSVLATRRRRDRRAGRRPGQVRRQPGRLPRTGPSTTSACTTARCRRPRSPTSRAPARSRRRPEGSRLRDPSCPPPPLDGPEAEAYLPTKPVQSAGRSSTRPTRVDRR